MQGDPAPPQIHPGFPMPLCSCACPGALEQIPLCPCPLPLFSCPKAYAPLPLPPACSGAAAALPVQPVFPELRTAAQHSHGLGGGGGTGPPPGAPLQLAPPVCVCVCVCGGGCHPCVRA